MTSAESRELPLEPCWQEFTLAEENNFARIWEFDRSIPTMYDYSQKLEKAALEVITKEQGTPLPPAVIYEPFGTKEDLREYLTKGDEQKIYGLCDPQTDALRGYISLSLFNESSGFPRVEVQTMAVSTNWRKRGYARKLLRKGEEYARERNADRILLYVSPKNWPALGVYIREGYNPPGKHLVAMETETRDHFPFDGGEPRILLAKPFTLVKV